MEHPQHIFTALLLYSFLAFCLLRKKKTGEILGLKIKDEKVIEEKVLYKHRSGIVDVKFLPDGYLYFLSRDGIYRVVIMDGG